MKKQLKLGMWALIFSGQTSIGDQFDGSDKN